MSTTELSAGDALTSAEELRAETILLNDQIAHLRAASRDDRTLVAALKEQRQAATAGMQSAKEETLRLGTELLSARRAVEQHHRISSRRAQELGRLQAALADSRDAFDPAVAAGFELNYGTTWHGLKVKVLPQPPNPPTPLSKARRGWDFGGSRCYNPPL